MRIGLFTHVFPPMVNGIATSVSTLAKELEKMGHNVFIIQNNYNSFKNDFSDKTNLKVISIPIAYQNLRVPIIFNPNLFLELDKLNLDIIHCHSDFGIGYLARIYSLRKNIPLVQTYHCNYIEYANANFGNGIGSVSKIPVDIYTNCLVWSSKRFIAPSDAIFELLIDEFKIKKHIDLIPNGIDFDKFSVENVQSIMNIRNKYNLKPNDFVLLSLSRLSKEKRIGDIICLLPYLKDCKNLKLLIVGKGPDELELKKKTYDLHLDNVIFTGEIPNNEVVNYYKIADMFITNSIAETQGLTFIESLASSTPVLCIYNKLYTDIVQNGINGFLFKTQSELVDLIKLLYKRRYLVRELEEYTVSSVSKYSIKETSQEIFKLYDEEVFKATRCGKRRVLSKK